MKFGLNTESVFLFTSSAGVAISWYYDSELKRTTLHINIYMHRLYTEQLVTMMVMATNESNCVVRFFYSTESHAHKHTHIHTHSIWPLMVPYGTGHIAHQLLFTLLAESVAVCESVCLSRSHASAMYTCIACDFPSWIFRYTPCQRQFIYKRFFHCCFLSVAALNWNHSQQQLRIFLKKFVCLIKFHRNRTKNQVKRKEKRRTYSTLCRNSTHILSVTVFWKRLIKIKYTVCEIDRRADKKASNWYSKQRLFHHIIITTIETECVYSLHYQK